MSPETLAPLQPLQAPYFEHLQRLVAELRANPDQILELEGDSFAAFDCIQCGDCCQLPWNIHVTQAYYEQWYACFDQHPSGRFSEPFKLLDEPTPQNYASMRRKPGSHACIFLEDDDSCFIHTNHGVEALSQICRVYPRQSKYVGDQFAMRALLHSCRAVPELELKHPGISYRLQPIGGGPMRVQVPQPPDHPGRDETYLWIGMMLDLLAAPQPETSLARWRRFLPSLEWMDGIGLSQLSEADLVRLYRAQMDQLAFAAFEPPPAPERQQRALDWALRLMHDHPSCKTWIQDILSGRKPWPRPSDEERARLDAYLHSYLRKRALGLPYYDNFLGKVTIWQQFLMLAMQVLALQCLALCYCSQDASPLQDHHLQRAGNAVGYHYEQRMHLLSALGFDKLSPAEAFDVLETLHAVDFAAAPVWMPA